jgi:hypothetical protein
MNKSHLLFLAFFAMSMSSNVVAMEENNSIWSIVATATNALNSAANITAETVMNRFSYQNDLNKTQTMQDHLVNINIAFNSMLIPINDQNSIAKKANESNQRLQLNNNIPELTKQIRQSIHNITPYRQDTPLRITALDTILEEIKTPKQPLTEENIKNYKNTIFSIVYHSQPSNNIHDSLILTNDISNELFNQIVERNPNIALRMLEQKNEQFEQQKQLYDNIFQSLIGQYALLHQQEIQKAQNETKTIKQLHKILKQETTMMSSDHTQQVAQLEQSLENNKTQIQELTKQLEHLQKQQEVLNKKEEGLLSQEKIESNNPNFLKKQIEALENTIKQTEKEMATLNANYLSTLNNNRDFSNQNKTLNQTLNNITSLLGVTEVSLDQLSKISNQKDAFQQFTKLTPEQINIVKTADSNYLVNVNLLKKSNMELANTLRNLKIAAIFTALASLLATCAAYKAGLISFNQLSNIDLSGINWSRFVSSSATN